MMPELNRIYTGDCLEIMRSWPDAFVQTVVTSPPYWGLRDYGVASQLGLEKTPEDYVSRMVEVFREVRRVLRDDGTLWLNLGDSYVAAATGSNGQNACSLEGGRQTQIEASKRPDKLPLDLKPKNLVGIPWRVAFALQADGWYLRSDIIWAKPNPMPESVTDRPTKAHEYLFLMAKSERYYYDAGAIKESALFGTTKMPDGWDTGPGAHGSFHRNGCEKGRKALSATQAKLGVLRDKQRGHGRRHAGFNDRWDDMEKAEQCSGLRNKRSVWTVGTSPFPEAHFATFPPDLIKPCILAGSKPGDIVLDPFMGAGTTALVAATYGRNFLGTELNPEYVAIAERRIASEVAQEKMAI